LQDGHHIKGTSVNTKLKQILNWSELALQANWSAQKLAEKCHVSERTLRRHFLKTMGKNVRGWLTEQRQKMAIELLLDGSSVKEVASHLGYKQPTNFARKYKKHTGGTPCDFKISK
jgi:AraC-like DNA-binding protein